MQAPLPLLCPDVKTLAWQEKESQEQLGKEGDPPETWGSEGHLEKAEDSQEGPLRDTHTATIPKRYFSLRSVRSSEEISY